MSSESVQSSGDAGNHTHGGPHRRGGVTAALASGSRCPAEHVGLARSFRNRITSAYRDFDSGMERLLDPFGGQNRSPLSRASLLKRFPSDWRELPPFGQLRLKIVQTGGGVAIDEVRCAPTAMLRSDWTEPEASVAVVLFSIRVEQRVATDLVRVLAIVGLHSLARRYERGDDRADLAVMRDLLPIVTAWPSAIRRPGDFEIPAGSGAWRGETASITLAGETMTALAVRTFVS